jgi:hypothetical protein
MVKKSFIILFLSILLISMAPMEAEAAGFFDIGGKINEYLTDGLNKDIEAGMKNMRKVILGTDSTAKNRATMYWIVITKSVAWVLFAIMLAAALGVNIGSPFVTGRLQFGDDHSIVLTGLGSGLMIYAGDDLITWLRVFSAGFTETFAVVNFTYPTSNNAFIGLGLQVTGIVVLALYALYQLRDLMISILIVMAPIAGATIVYTERFFTMWWQWALAWILMKPVHAFLLSFFLDYSSDIIDPADKLLVITFFFAIILLLPGVIFGGMAMKTFRDIKNGGL